MTHDEFITTVELAAGVGRERAERAARATLQTLGERIAAGKARDLADRLPPKLAPWIATAGDTGRFGVDEFLRRVAEREDVEIAEAEVHARAVLGALARALSPRELADMAVGLSQDFASLLPRGPQLEVVAFELFLRRVADRAGVDRDGGARRAADAVLETLAERIAAGEVEDLIARLPTELHLPLERGRKRNGGQVRRMSLERFVQRVAEREGIDGARALAHARAVVRTLREAVGEHEFFDVTVQLPDDYATVLAR